MGNFMRFIKASMAVSMALVLVGVNGVDAYAGAKSEKVSISLVGKYDSSDTASIRSVDTENTEIRFMFTVTPMWMVKINPAMQWGLP